MQGWSSGDIKLLDDFEPARTQVFVNCDPQVGSDDGPGDGSEARPFLTLMHARNIVRERREFTKGPFEVVVTGDCLPRDPGTGKIDFNFAGAQMSVIKRVLGVPLRR